MELIARLGEREERIEIRREGDLYLIRIGEREHRVDAAEFGGQGRSLLVDGRQFEVVTRVLGEGRYRVVSSRGQDDVEVLDPLTHLARQAHAAVEASGAETVTAYMPGRVVALLAEEGESLEPGRGVLVLEAMKMENEIQSERSGTLKRILVESGQAVESGDALFEIE
ncbi:MAG: biotin/lipoyl-containing protein [Thermoanaerobaculia bacterium]|nr:biotin/lipoyl-containing protein [Thermoanaerobaculia bacterium]